MRTCKKCETTMVEMLLDTVGPISVKRESMNENSAKVKCSVCPKCGDIDLHLDGAGLKKIEKQMNRS